MADDVPAIPEVAAEFDFGPYKSQVGPLWADYKKSASGGEKASALMVQIEDLTVDTFIASDGLYGINRSDPANLKEYGIFKKLDEAIRDVTPAGIWGWGLDDGFVKRILKKVYLRMKEANRPSAVTAGVEATRAAAGIGEEAT